MLAVHTQLEVLLAERFICRLAQENKETGKFYFLEQNLAKRDAAKEAGISCCEKCTLIWGQCSSLVVSGFTRTR